ncbi:MAG: JAB domain-containing protein, partial [Chlorobiaceae bacterium]|nr:JAB domain-containing protein [Chlorobiaceae bacterium]
MKHEQSNLVTVPVYKLKMVKDAEHRVNICKPTSADSIAKLLLYLGFHEKPCEEYHVIYLDCANQFAGMELISMGTVNHAIIHP